METLNEILIQLNQSGILAVLCLFTLGSVFLCGLSLLLYFHGSSRMKELQKELEALSRRVQSVEHISSKRENKKTLNEAALKSRYEKITATKTIPEKYRHIAQLEKSGIGAKEIADILDVSQNEAEQMISLARLAKG